MKKKDVFEEPEDEVQIIENTPSKMQGNMNRELCEKFAFSHPKANKEASSVLRFGRHKLTVYNDEVHTKTRGLPG